MAVVRMSTLECGPNGNFPEGSLREVTFEQGEMLVATRHAVWVDKGVRQIEVTQIQEREKAFVEVPEVTAPRKSNRR